MTAAILVVAAGATLAACGSDDDVDAGEGAVISATAESTGQAEPTSPPTSASERFIFPASSSNHTTNNALDFCS
jgi:hypothetical protein